MNKVILARACTLLFLGAFAAQAQPIPIVIPNGGAAGLGSIYFFDPVTAKLNPAFEFTTTVPGRNPVELTFDQSGDIYGITEYGGKYDHGVIFKIDRNTEEFKTLFENPFNQYRFTSLFFIDGQLYAQAKERQKDGVKVFKINSGGDLTMDNSVQPSPMGGPDPKLFGKNETCDSYLPYNNGFVGLGMVVEHGPPDNPWVSVTGTFLFRWTPPETKIRKLQSWEYRETSNIALNGDIAYYTWQGEAGIQTYDLSSTTMATLPIDADNTPTYIFAYNNTVWGISPVTDKVIGIDLQSKSLWTSDEEVINPKEFKLANDRIYFNAYGDLGSYPGSVMVLDTQAKQLKKLVAFGQGVGREPLPEMVKLGDNFYGAAYRDGEGTGALFTLDKNLKYRTLKSFTRETGTRPVQLIAHGDRVFGINQFGGRENAGVLFSYQPQQSEFKILYEFQELGARSPIAMLDVNNSLYIACYGGKMVRGDVVVYNIDQNNSRVVSSNKWTTARDMMFDGKEIYILARPRGAGKDGWLRFSEGDGLPPVPQFPTQKTTYINGTGYYLDKGKLYKWKAGAPPTILMEFPTTDLNANLATSGDYLLVSTFPDYAHMHPDGSSIYAYNLKTSKSQTLLKGKSFIPPAIKSASAEKLPTTFIIEGVGIWVRDAPTTGKVVMKLNDNDVCQVLEKGKYQEIRGVKNFWYKIKFKNQVGWVFGSQGRFEN